MALGVRGMPNVQGGVETHAEQLYERLAALGCDIEVIVRSPYVPAHQVRTGRIRLRRIWSPQLPGFEAIVHSFLGVLYAGLKRPDILHIHAVGPAIVAPIARLLGLKVLVTHHGPDYDRDKWGRFARWVLRTGERLGMRYSHARVSISKVISDLVWEKYGLESDLIPNGVSIQAPCKDSETLDRFGLVPGRYFLQVSRLVPEKRQLDLIRAFETARPAGWKLVLAGALDGSAYCHQLQAATRGSDGSEVVLTGFLTGAPLRQLYSHAGAFVLPSSHEGLPIAMLEALSYGLPVIASDIPANLEVGLPGNHYFGLGDLGSLAAILREFSLKPLTDIQREANKRLVSGKYNWDGIAERTLKVYRRMLDI